MTAEREGRDVADGVELKRLYEQRFAGRTEYRTKVWQTLCAQMFNRWIRPTDSVLDLGSGYCEFINNVTAGQKMAMDLNPDAAARAAKGVEMVLHDCSTPWPIAVASLDAIFTSNFLEHLFDKATVSKTLKQAFASLKPGGTLVAMGPNIRFVGGAYWDYFDHHVALTENSLAEVLEEAGFTIEKSVAKFLPYSMSEGSERPIALLKLYLKLPLVWRFFGKQFLVVARKPSN